MTNAGAAAYVRSTPIFLYPDWWINENIAAFEEREKLTITSFPPAEIVTSRIDAIVDFDPHECARVNQHAHAGDLPGRNGDVRHVHLLHDFRENQSAVNRGSGARRPIGGLLGMVTERVTMPPLRSRRLSMR